MAKAPFQSTAVDESGNVLDWPFVVTVRREATNGIARIYDRDDTPLPNPLTVSALNGWAEGFFRFHAAGGSYRIDVTKGSYAAEPLRDVQIGTYAGADQGALLEEGYLHEYEAETVAPPSEGFFRFNNVNVSLATVAWVSKTTRGGYDVGERLLELDPGPNSIKSTLHFRGAEVTGASYLVDAADDDSGSDDYVTIDLSAHAGDAAFETEVYSLQREIAGRDGEDSAQSVNGQTHAASSKSAPIDADEMPLVDTEAANALKKWSVGNLKTLVITAFGALINGLTGKTTPVDADMLTIADSAASNASKKLTLANLKAFLKAYFDPLYDPSGSPKVRAWCNFNGTGTPALRASYNVLSITDHGTGDYTLNYTNAISDADYAFVGTTGYAPASAGAAPVVCPVTYSTGSTRFNITRYSDGVFDTSQINIVVVR